MTNLDVSPNIKTEAFSVIYPLYNDCSVKETMETRLIPAQEISYKITY